MNNIKDDDAVSSLSDSSQKNDSKIEAKSQNKSSSNSKKKMEKGKKRLFEVQAIWAEHEKWLRNSAYSQPQAVENIFPQFFADIRNESNLQMAQVFCLPLVSMKVMIYEERIAAWSYNIICYFGPFLSESQYSLWKTNSLITVADRSGTNEEKSNAIKMIRVRLFFHDLHTVFDRMRLSKRFLNDLLHAIWIRLESEDDYDELPSNHAVNHAYHLIPNECLTEDSLQKQMATIVCPDKKVLNTLSHQ